MTNNLKCPFCQQDLRTVLDSPFYTCDSCGYTGYKQLWQALIQAKQDLEITTKALENIVSDYEVDASNGWLAANAKKTLEQIKHKE